MPSTRLLSTELTNNAATYRGDLSLGDSATKDTGTTAGTVAAGDDARIAGAAQKSANLSDLGSVEAARGVLGWFQTRSEAAAASIASTVSTVTLAGYAAAGDGGAATYKRVVAEPSHPGKLQSADGAWWEISEAELDAAMFGAAYDGVASDATAASNCATTALALGHSYFTLKGASVKFGANVDCQGLDVVGAGGSVVSDGYFLRNLGPGRYRGLKVQSYYADQPLVAPSTRGPNNPKLLFPVTSGLTGTATYYAVLTRGLGPTGVLMELLKGNVVDGGDPPSSVGGTYDLWRLGYVNRVVAAWAYVATRTAEVGSWADYTVTSTVLGLTTGTAYRAPVARRITGGSGAYCEFTIDIPTSGEFKIAFVATATTSNAQTVKVDGTTVATLDCQNASTRVVVHTVKGRPGTGRVVRLDQIDTAGMYVLGVHFDSYDAVEIGRAYDTLAIFTDSPGYITSRGASDYAIEVETSPGTRIYGGSYHGGETALTPAEFFLDGVEKVAADLTSKPVWCVKDLKVRQHTQIAYSNGATITVRSLKYFLDGSHCMDVEQMTTAQVYTGFFGMTTAGTAFTDTSAPAYSSTADGQEALMGPTNMVRQVDPARGLCVTTELSVQPGRGIPSWSHAGPFVSAVAGAYWKLYCPTMRHSNTTYSAGFRASLVQTFH